VRAAWPQLHLRHRMARLLGGLPLVPSHGGAVAALVPHAAPLNRAPRHRLGGLRAADPPGLVVGIAASLPRPPERAAGIAEGCTGRYRSRRVLLTMRGRQAAAVLAPGALGGCTLALKVQIQLTVRHAVDEYECPPGLAQLLGVRVQVCTEPGGCLAWGDNRGDAGSLRGR
jgi:hypothetical protein